MDYDEFYQRALIAALSGCLSRAPGQDPKAAADAAAKVATEAVKVAGLKPGPREVTMTAKRGKKA